MLPSSVLDLHCAADSEGEFLKNMNTQDPYPLRSELIGLEAGSGTPPFKSSISDSGALPKLNSGIPFPFLLQPLFSPLPWVWVSSWSSLPRSGLNVNETSSWDGRGQGLPVFLSKEKKVCVYRYIYLYLSQTEQAVESIDSVTGTPRRKRSWRSVWSSHILPS